MKNKDNEQQLPLAGSEEGEILARLSERVERAIVTIQELRRERDQLKARVTELQEQLSDHDDAKGRLTDLEDETERFRKERTEIRGRLETILTTLETLEEAPEGEE